MRLIQCLVFSLVLVVTTVHANLSTPVGLWQTIDDVTGKPRSVVKIFEDNNKLYAIIKSVYSYKDEHHKTLFCTHCRGTLKNRHIIGLTFMWNIKPVGKLQWGDGAILDPHNGKIYRCRLTLAPKGNRLLVRGYVGIPLLGRSQTWLRVVE